MRATVAGTRSRRGSLLHGLAVGVALVLGVLGLSTVAGEALLRLGLPPNYAYAEIRYDRLWREAERRVLMLGDSVVHPYRGTGHVAAERLSERGVALRCLALNGTGPYTYLDRLRTWEPVPEPDLVVVAYDARNDLTDVRDHPRHDPEALGQALRLETPYLEKAAEESWLDGLFLWHHRRMRSVRPVQFPWWRFRRAGLPARVISGARTRRVNPWFLMRAVYTPDYPAANLLVETERDRQAWEDARAVLAEIDEEVRARGLRLAVVVFPSALQVDDSLVELFGEMGLATDPRMRTSRRPQELVAGFCAERGIEHLDLLPTLLEHAGEGLFEELEDALNERGQELAAERIAAFVDEVLRGGGP